MAIVTGASRGIGEAIAKGLSEFGAKVVLASRKQEVLDEVKKEIEEAGGEALAVATHIGHLEAIDNLIKTTLDAYGTDRHPGEQRRHQPLLRAHRPTPTCPSGTRSSRSTRGASST